MVAGDGEGGEGGTGGEGREGATRRELVGQLEVLRQRERETGKARDAERDGRVSDREKPDVSVHAEEHKFHACRL